MPDAKVSALADVTLPLDGTEVLPVVQGGSSKKMTALAAGMQRVISLTADQSNSTVTPTKVTGMDLATGVGTFVFQYFIRYQAAALTTGVRFDVNHSGTVVCFIWNQEWIDAGSVASTTAVAPSQNNTAAAGGVQSGFSSRAKGTAGRGTTASVDTINADMLMIIRGLAIVSVAGNMELYHGSEVAAASTVKAGSSLILTRTA